MHNLNTQINFVRLEENAGSADYFGEPVSHLFSLLESICGNCDENATWFYCKYLGACERKKKMDAARCVYFPQNACNSCGSCVGKEDKQAW